MHLHFKGIATKALAILGAGLVFCTGTASAQMFEGHYGAEYCRESGNSVIPVREGGYISVGNKSCKDCGNNDLYVVRTHDNGSLLWSVTYDLGGNDIANSVKEVVNDPNGNGGFILTGYTDNLNSPCGEANDAFLLRIDRCGNLIWANTYGYIKTTESGHEVVEATGGRDDYKTRPGDFIVAGWTTFEATDGNRNGYIFRTDANGNLIWDGVYEGPERQDDYFYSIDEAQFERTDETPDVVVAGGTGSYGAGNQAWIVRVSGNDGRFWNNYPHGSATYGADGFEEFRSIRELRIRDGGSLVATGYTTSITGGREVYAVQTKPHPCDYVADRAFGDYGKYPEEGFAIRETVDGGDGYDKGDIVITGYAHTPDGYGHGGEDAFLQVLRSGTLELVPGCFLMLYGGEGNDRGLSVESLSDNYPCRSRGFIVSGFNQSPDIIGADPQQLYLVKTDENRKNPCVIDYKVECKQPGWRHECKNPEVIQIGKYCETKTEPICHYDYKVYCFESLGTEFCELKWCENCPPPKKRNNGTSESGISSVAGLSSFPNPVKSGSAITLQYTLTQDAPVSISVSDISGRTVYTNTINSTSGVSTAAVETKGWTSGSYVVSVSVNGKATTTRVVVTE